MGLVHETIDDTVELDSDILAFIKAGTDQPEDDLEFNELALRLFNYQFLNNEPYRKYCLRRSRTPDSVIHWKEIPAVPTVAFKELSLTCFPVEKATVVFMTSGTTLPGKRGKHYLENLDLYNASLKPNFKDHLLPDRDRMRMLVLGPSLDVMPHSSLGHMIEVVVEEFGATESGFFLKPEGLDTEGLTKTLRQVEKSKDPVCLLGTVFGFVRFFDFCKKEGVRFSLPPGSRLMDTGGFKGKSREVPKTELYGMYFELLGIPEHYCINEYGMTEMGTQFYDCVLKNKVRGLQESRYKVIPPWARTVVVDSNTLEELPKGGIGLLRHYDLSNRGSVIGIQTEDIGYQVGEGFEILGRAKESEARGCSIAIDEMGKRQTGRNGEGEKSKE